MSAYKQAFSQLDADTWPPAFSETEERLTKALEEAEEPVSGLEAFEETEELSEIEELAGFTADVNTSCFAGMTERIDRREDLIAKLHELSPFCGCYLWTIEEEGLKDFTFYSGAKTTEKQD